MWLTSQIADWRELARDAVFPNKPSLTEHNLPDLKGRVYVVTGATAGIGFEAARLLLLAGAKVWVIGRTESKLEAAKAKLGEIGTVRALQLKFEDPATIAHDITPLLAEEKRLDGVIHNAGMNYRGAYYTSGFLDLIVVNVFGPWVLQSHLDSLLIETAKTAPQNSVRIVWVASSAHYFSPQCGGIDWDNPNNEQINGRLGFGIYGQTKAMNIYQAYLWGKQHKESGVVSVCTHPGTVESEIRRYRPDRNRNMAALCAPTIFGAYAEITPLLDPTVTESDNGVYFRPYGARGRVRPDVYEAIHGPRGEKFYSWLTEETTKIVNAGPQGSAKPVG